MALQLTKAVTDGSRRVLSRTGGVLFAALLVHQLAVVTSLNTVIAAQLPPAATEVVGLSLPVPAPVAGAVLAAAVGFGGVYFVVLARALTRPTTRLSSFPADLYTRRIGRATLTMLVGGAVVSLAVTVGFVLLFLPGLFLAACFLFFAFAVGVEDRGVVGAIERSWRISRGNRLRLVAFVLAVGALGLLFGTVPAALQVAGAAALGDLVSALLNAALYTFVHGVAAAAYLQLADGGRGPGGSNAVASPGAEHAADL
ncbi:MAG: hypothetical protein ABEJ61_00680 [Haloferacaceae archaeon]